jgi:HAD superfamily hydrolase (TIGR01549 family)
MASRIDAVLFDAYYTLWFPARTVEEMWADVLDQFGTFRTHREIMSAVAEHDRWKELRLLSFETSEQPVDDETIEVLWADFDGRVLHSLGVHASDEAVASKVLPVFNDFNALYDDTLEVLASIRKLGYRIGIVSNGGYQRRAAARLGIERYFESIVGSWHVGFMKPDPKIFDLALVELDVPAEHALMIGDTWEDDVEGARSLGMRALHLRREETVDVLRDEISSLHGVIDFLNHQRQQRE